MCNAKFWDFIVVCVIAVPDQSCLELPSPDTGEALHITTTLRGVRNYRTTPPQAIRHEAAALLQDELSCYLPLFTDGCVMHSTCKGVAACLVPEQGASRSCSLPFSTSSTRPALARLPLAADLP